MRNGDRGEALIPMPFNEPGEYLDSSDLTYLGDVLDPHLREILLIEFALSRTKSATRVTRTDFPSAIEEDQS